MKFSKTNLLVGLSALALVSGAGCAYARTDMMRYPQPDRRIPEISRPMPVLLPAISNVRFSCGNPSSSLVRATLINKNGFPQSYIPMLTLQPMDKCIKWSSSHCDAFPEGMLCVPRCQKFVAGKAIMLPGESVTVPASGKAAAVIYIPNRAFKNAVFSVGSVKVSVTPKPYECIF